MTLQRQSSDTSFAKMDMETASMSEMSETLTTTNYINKKFYIELHIKCLFSEDIKFFNEQFKIYWIRNKKKIDTRTATVNPDTQTAKFSDKFQMRTVLQVNEETGEFKSKPSELQVIHLSEGTEIDIGSVQIDLAQFAMTPGLHISTGRHQPCRNKKRSRRSFGNQV